jgi:twitching motility protein PilT
MSTDYQKELETFIEAVVQEGASDLHLSVNTFPTIRVDGALIPLQAKRNLTDEDLQGFAKTLLSEEQFEQLQRREEVDFSYSYRPQQVRFRGNAFYERGHIGIALRLIPKEIRPLQELGLPEQLAEFARKRQGFFLVTGPVGQGKTTTLASLVQMINDERTEHIITIEDPIEYVYENNKSIIDQREVGIDTASFESALTSAFRQDVDVILLGEMREIETISAAVTAAETGHLIFSTLHTNNAAQTIDRIIDSFPEAQQDQVRLQLSSSLAGVFSQRLIPRISGGLVPAYELLKSNDAVANLIREGRTHEIQSVIETGSEKGMIDMNRTLAELVRRGEITVEDAFARSFNPQGLERLL